VRAYKVLHPGIAETGIFDRLPAFRRSRRAVSQPLLGSSLRAYDSSRSLKLPAVIECFHFSHSHIGKKSTLWMMGV
jgi:hypothetical protein